MKKPLGICLALSCSLAFADAPPYVPDLHWAPTLAHPPSIGVTVGRFRILFENTTLADVAIAALGGEIRHMGDAGDSVYWLCFTNPGSGFADQIWIVSSGEMGGSEHEITEVIAKRTHGRPVTSPCPTLPVDMRYVSFDGHLWLGDSDGKIGSRLGPPSTKDGLWRTFDYQGKVPGRCEGGFDQTDWLTTKSSHNRVTLIAAGQVTSC
jgi:hypothetical protein